MALSKKVPVCIGCEHLQCYGRFRGMVHYWCRFTGQDLWIPAKDRGNTSPKWCPKRIANKLTKEA